jgi:hypothetical protein
MLLTPVVVRWWSFGVATFRVNEMDAEFMPRTYSKQSQRDGSAKNARDALAMA